MSEDPVDFLGHIQRCNSPAHAFNRYAYSNNNPYKYTDPDGEFAILAAVPWAATAIKAALFTGSAAAVGYGASEAKNYFNESSNADADAGAQVDSEIDGLTEGLLSETDSRGRDRKRQFVDSEGNADSALDSLTGETGDNG